VGLPADFTPIHTTALPAGILRLLKPALAPILLLLLLLLLRVFLLSVVLLQQVLDEVSIFI
jgi:hypothetical protein